MAAIELDRKAAILSATVDEVIKHGFDGASIQGIAEAAGVSTGLVMYHFKTKEDLIAAAWDLAVRHFTGRTIDNQDSLTGLKRFEKSFHIQFVDRDAATPPWNLWLELWAKAARSPRLRQLHSDRIAEVRRSYTQYLQRSIESGEMKDGIDPELAGDLLHTLVYGLAVKVTLDSESISPERAYQIAALAMDLLSNEKEVAPPQE